MSGLSTLARPITPLRMGDLRSAGVYGLAVHTTGSGIVDQARKQGRDPFQHAVDYYTKSPFYAHYVIGWDGTIVQICNEGVRAQHIGFAERPLYLSGAWKEKLSVENVELWRKNWPGVASPAGLFPGPSPNNAFIGVELLILEDQPIIPPAFVGSRYTMGQHRAVVLLAADIAERRHFPKDWALGPRLLTHEDVNPLTRTNAGGGWDPGAMRALPWLNMQWIRTALSGDRPLLVGDAGSHEG